MQDKSTLQRDYGDLIPTIQRLSIAAQFISGATGAFGIYIVILEKMPIPFKVLAIVVTVILTTIVIGSFEGGIRKLFPFWVRQILNWLFDENKEDRRPRSIRVILFVMLCILLIPLVIGTSLASWKASPDLVAFTTPPPPVKDLGQVSQSMDKSAQNTLQLFERDFNTDKQRFAKQLETEKAKWLAKINAQQVKRKNYLNLYGQGHQWAGGGAAKIKNQVIPDLRSQMQEALSALQTEQNSRLNALRMQQQTTFETEQQNKQRVLRSNEELNQRAVEHTDRAIDKWGSFLAILAIVSTFFSLFCLGFIEAYRIGILPNGMGVFPEPNHIKNSHKIENFKLNNKYPKNGITKMNTNNIIGKNEVAPSTQLMTNTMTHNTQSVPTNEYQFVSIDNLIKRTRQQYARSKDNTRTPESRERNRQKADKNILFLRSLGMQVEEDLSNRGKLKVWKKEIA